MSNSALIKQIRSVMAQLELGQMSSAYLQDVFENSTSALEALPYSINLELRKIGSRLAIERSYKEEKCEPRVSEAFIDLKPLLERVPTMFNCAPCASNLSLQRIGKSCAFTGR